jgi:hypothetical protein
LDHTDNLRKAIASDILSQTTKRVEKKMRRDAFRSSVLDGDYLPPHATVDIRHETKYHLHYMTSWIEVRIAPPHAVFFANHHLNNFPNSLCSSQERTNLTAKMEALPITQKAETEVLVKKQKADMSSARSALEVNISKRRKEKTAKEEDAINKTREWELESKKASFTEENPMPSSFSSDFFAETSKLIKAKKVRRQEQSDNVTARHPIRQLNPFHFSLRFLLTPTRTK